MTERIKAVQRAFLALLCMSFVVIAIGVPMRGDGATLSVLNELEAFDAAFDRAKLEQVLLAHARVQGMVGLDAVAAAARGPGVPKLTVVKDAAPVSPRTALALGTLAQIHALSAPGATLDLGVVSADALGPSLAWRLSRRSGAEGFELQSIDLGKAGCNAADLKLEAEVNDARAVVRGAQKDLDDAVKDRADAEQLWEARRKWKAPWKSIMKANEKRLEAMGVEQRAQKALSTAQARYEGLVKQTQTEERAPSATCAIATATLRELPSGARVELKLPTPIEQRAVPVPTLTGTAFAVTHAAGRWEELSGLSNQDAMARLRGQFSWHYRYSEIGGFKVGGMTVVQLAPLLLLPFFFAVIRRSRGVGASYNPFDRPAGETLPMVGFGASVLNAVVLVLLPLAGCVLCAVTLVQLEQAPIIPVLCALGCVALGANSTLALGELLELREAVTRSHSNPPPAPSTPAR